MTKLGETCEPYRQDGCAVGPTSISKACMASIVLQSAAPFNELQAVIGKSELSADQLSELLHL